MSQNPFGAIGNPIPASNRSPSATRSIASPAPSQYNGSAIQFIPSMPLPRPDGYSASPAPALPPPPPDDTQLLSSYSQTINQLSSLFSAALAHQYVDPEEIERLRGEVEVWKGSYYAALKEKKGMEGYVGELVAETAKSVEGRVEAERGLKEMKDQIENRPLFTAVLLDGDGLIFHESLLSQGAAGGKQAARTLLSALPSLLPHLPAQPKGNVLGKVVVNLFVNKLGLVNACVKAGLASSHQVMNEFFTGLSQSHDLISVVDVGGGKEAVDAKLREYLRLYVSNTQCGFILLGASHDNGYAPILSSLSTEGQLHKILLLKGYSSVAYELQQYAELMVEIDGLFRPDKIPWIPGAGTTPKLANKKPVEWAQVVTGKKAVGVPASEKKKKTKTGQAQTQTPSQKPAWTPSVASSDAASSGYVDASENEDDEEEMIIRTDGLGSKDMSIGKMETRFADVLTLEQDAVKKYEMETPSKADRPIKQLKEVSTPNGTPKPATIFGSGKADKDFTFSMVLTEDQGWVGVKTKKEKKEKKEKYDKPSRSSPKSAKHEAKYDVDVETEGNKKHKKTIRVDGGDAGVKSASPRPCHKEYLVEGGCTNPSCAFGHEYNLNKGQKALLRKLAADMPCPFLRTSRCKGGEETCIYGHVCPYGEDCTWGDGCRFKDLPGGGHVA